MITQPTLSFTKFSPMTTDNSDIHRDLWISTAGPPWKSLCFGVVITATVLLLAAGIVTEILKKSTPTTDRQVVTVQMATFWLGSNGVIGTLLLCIICVILGWSMVMAHYYARVVARDVQQGIAKLTFLTQTTLAKTSNFNSVSELVTLLASKLQQH